MRRIYLLFFIAVFFFGCGGHSSSGDYDTSVPMPSNIPPPAPVIYKVINTYPHDSTSFTQGLEFYNGKLYEGTGEEKQSKIRIVNLKTGIPEFSHTLSDPKIFGEGITILNGKLYQLTWQNNKIFEYNLKDLSTPVKTYAWPKEGWGATNNGREIIISDGTSNLYFVTPDEKSNEMKVNKILSVKNNMGPVDSLNELELINGYVYANRWLTSQIVKIDTTTGNVTGVMDFTGIMRQYDPSAVLQDGSVLNGIAYDSTTKKIFITGKDWPKVFEIELMP
ncbi:MAG: glutaminyl-peptide cyclotransferase [Chitinophagaceae bacterium]|nr:glutaminyl-peptide cyclotransferase [Chitinophagaceae bacterium]